MGENAFLDDIESFGTPERALRETMRREKSAVAGSGIDKIKDLLRSWYESGDIGVGPEAMGVGGMVSMARPGSRAWPKIQELFGDFINTYPKVNLQRFQNEKAGEEVYRRGGEYYLGLDPDSLVAPQYKKPATYGEGEGGELLKLRQLEFENPTFVSSKGYTRSFLDHFLGENMGRELKTEFYNAVELQKGEMAETVRRKGRPTDPVAYLQSGLLGKIGAKPEEIRQALSARETRDALYDLYKTKLLKREGIDAIVRKRLSSISEPEVFVVNPRTPKLQPIGPNELTELPGNSYNRKDTLYKLLERTGLLGKLTE